MSSTSPWEPGNVVVLRGVWRQKLWVAGPAILVEDDPDLIALYWRAGTRMKTLGRRMAARDLLPSAKIDLVDHIWSETDVLALAKPGEAHSVWAMWETGQPKLRCWYVNLQTPLQRTSLGFDSMDYELDIVISPDLSQWRWKDEDEFQELTAAGMFTREEARAIRAEGECVLRQMSAGGAPFCDGWEKWSPPSGWAIPELPPGWDEL